VNSTIWKYDVPVEDTAYVEMPEDAEILHVGQQFPVNISSVTVWARVDPGAPLSHRKLYMRGTGHELGADLPHLGTVIVAGGSLVWHVFDGGWVV
jgi:hypothetical protein